MLRLVSLLSKFKRFWVAGWVAGRVAGKAENIDQLSPAKLEFGLRLSLAKLGEIVLVRLPQIGYVKFS